jgi:hypothetical protein
VVQLKERAFREDLDVTGRIIHINMDLKKNRILGRGLDLSGSGSDKWRTVVNKSNEPSGCITRR